MKEFDLIKRTVKHSFVTVFTYDNCPEKIELMVTPQYADPAAVFLSLDEARALINKIQECIDNAEEKEGNK